MPDDIQPPVLSDRVGYEGYELEDSYRVAYYVSPLARVVGNIRFSPGCVILPGASITVHTAAAASSSSSNPNTHSSSGTEDEAVNVSSSPAVLFSPYNLVEEYAEIHIYEPHSPPAPRSGDPAEPMIVIGSHNRFKSYSCLHTDQDIGDGNFFAPHSTVKLVQPSNEEVSRGSKTNASASLHSFLIGDHCRFSAHVRVSRVPFLQAGKQWACEVSDSPGAIKLNHCSVLLRAPMEEEDELESPVQSSVWVVPSGGPRGSRLAIDSTSKALPSDTTSVAELPDESLPLAMSFEEKRMMVEVEQMCAVYIELYGFSPFTPALNIE